MRTAKSDENGCAANEPDRQSDLEHDRPVQRFFSTVMPWPELFDRFFEQHLYNPKGEYFLVGDESIITKSGKETHGLDYFFSGLLNKVVKSIGIFTLALVDVPERQSYPLRVEQVVRSEAEKAAAKARKKRSRPRRKRHAKESRGDPKAARTGTKPKWN